MDIDGDDQTKDCEGNTGIIFVMFVLMTVGISSLFVYFLNSPIIVGIGIGIPISIILCGLSFHKEGEIDQMNGTKLIDPEGNKWVVKDNRFSK